MRVVSTIDRKNNPGSRVLLEILGDQVNEFDIYKDYFKLLFYIAKSYSNKRELILLFAPSLNFTTLITALLVGRKLVYHMTDSISLFQLRRKKKSFIRIQVARLVEFSYLFLFRRIIVVGRSDFEYLSQKYKVSSNKLIYAPNGVEVKTISQNVLKRKYGLNVFFIGSLDYQPNIDAVLEIIKIAQHSSMSHVKFHIAGKGLPARIQTIATKISNVSLTGWIDEPSEYFETCNVFLAPIKTGCGVQNKVLQAMSHGMYCLVSEEVASGLRQGAPVTTLEDEYENQVDQLLKLLEYSKINFINNSAINFVKNEHSWSSYQSLVFSAVELPNEFW